MWGGGALALRSEGVHCRGEEGPLQGGVRELPGGVMRAGGGCGGVGGVRLSGYAFGNEVGVRRNRGTE